MEREAEAVSRVMVSGQLPLNCNRPPPLWPEPEPLCQLTLVQGFGSRLADRHNSETLYDKAGLRWQGCQEGAGSALDYFKNMVSLPVVIHLMVVSRMGIPCGF